jgi:hypothetical protein
LLVFDFAKLSLFEDDFLPLGMDFVIAFDDGFLGEIIENK